MVKKHIPGLVIALLLIGIGFYYDQHIDSGLIEEVPNTRLAVVEGYQFKDSRLIKQNEKALNFYKRQDFENCVKTYEDMIIDGPEEPGSYAGLGTCQMWLNDHDGAEYNFTMALKFAPNSVRALNGLGAVASKRKNYETSIDYYKKSLKSNTNYVSSHEGIAYVYTKTHQYELAEKHYKKVLKLVPDTEMAARSEERLQEIQKQKIEQQEFN